MLSKVDIEKELSQGINVVPFKPENIKENSINLSASRYAWTMSNEDIFVKDGELFLGSTDGDNDYSEEKISFFKGKSAIYSMNGKEIIVLLPFSTTLIETEEVLAVSNNIGGSYHSKVGLVSKGLGHIGTMLGPNFSGHSLIAIHNVSKELLTIEVGETFVSVVFNYLNSPIKSNNPTLNGHLDKMAEWGIKLEPDERKVIGEDWKSDINFVREKMKKDKKFNEYSYILKVRKAENRKKYFNKKNVFIFAMITVSGISLYMLASYLDSKLKTPVWVDRFWNVGFSGILVSIFNSLIKIIKPSQ